MEKRLLKYLDDGKFVAVSLTTKKTMSSIKGKGNKSTELKLRMLLVKEGVKGWQLHVKHLPGKPDFYFERRKLAVFVDGCYWHGCPECGHIPKTRSEFWRAKFKRNKERDTLNLLKLKELGISVMRIWEHELKTNSLAQTVVSKLLDRVTSNK